MLTESEIQALLTGPDMITCMRPARCIMSEQACYAIQLRPRKETGCAGCDRCYLPERKPLSFTEMVQEHIWTIERNKEIKAEKRKTQAEHRQIANEKSAHHRKEFGDEVWQERAKNHGFSSEREMFMAWRLESNAEIARRLGVNKGTVRVRYRDRHNDIRRSE